MQFSYNVKIPQLLKALSFSYFEVCWPPLARNQYGNFQSRRKTIKKVSLMKNWV